MVKAGGNWFFRGTWRNAIAVVEYVFSSLLMLAERMDFHCTTVQWGSWALVTLVAFTGATGSVRDYNLALRSASPDRGDEGDFRSLDELVQHADF